MDDSYESFLLPAYIDPFEIVRCELFEIDKIYIDFEWCTSYELRPHMTPPRAICSTSIVAMMVLYFDCSRAPVYVWYKYLMARSLFVYLDMRIKPRINIVKHICGTGGHLESKMSFLSHCLLAIGTYPTYTRECCCCLFHTHTHTFLRLATKRLNVQNMTHWI